MRKKLLIPSIVRIVLAPVFVSAADTPSFVPHAFLPERVFEFHPVVEGSRIEHRLVLHNRGDAPLAILDIESG